jgi:pantoate--beta-alanine ligase
MSSRNRRLSAEEHQHALALHRALHAAETLVRTGEFSSQELRTAMLQTLQNDASVRIDYAEIVDPSTLERVEDTAGGALLAVAAQVGATRLIDNLLVERGTHA